MPGGHGCSTAGAAGAPNENCVRCNSAPEVGGGDSRRLSGLQRRGQVRRGTATLAEPTEAVTPEVATSSSEEHAAAKNRTAQREAMAWAARCDRQRRRKQRVAAATQAMGILAGVAFLTLCVVVVLVVAYALSATARHDHQVMVQVEQQRISQIEQRERDYVLQRLNPAEQARYNAVQQQIAQELQVAQAQP